MTAPVAVEVQGRRGVGTSTVTGALGDAGLQIAATGEVAVVVIAEVLKPEDRALLTELSRAGRPAVVVFNKADLAGSSPGGPMATAHRRARRLQDMAGVPVVPMVALLASVALAAHEVAALGVLTREPGDLTSADAFVDAPHRLPVEVRAGLLRRLDRFGIAHATLALSRGADAASLPGVLRGLSQVDRVLTAIDAAAAPVRYRRARWALTELRAIGGEAVGRFLAADDTVLAMMGAAVDVVQAEGLTVETGDGHVDHLCRARRWRHYRDGPVNALHRRCADDIVRGSLRLLDATAADRR
ncbi:hypothetical protein [Mycobacterium sp. E802]|uniref:hypothetical protein n=1 Tax=Mycobacterium sp. E802 TaxID=1834152 RepID=UPI001E48ED34|nr:hypothetical protein [Mycobacterium sp. E802]